MTGGGKLARCCERATISLALRVAVVVGTLLNLINHYDVLFGAPLTRAAVIQIALTYLVPYFVSTHGQVWSKI
ncbi:MAG TPA: nitrate/nitrite transporter NrtS [Burkholderiales bacterium]|jgi:hypothetical protein|nr:nitrate/nitrite transporter NrtS [Burkholderiales bacterium]